MDVNVALEVLIGLITMYLLLALLCTIINEMVATVLNWRAKTLKKGLESLLRDPNFTGLASGVLNSSIIRKAMEPQAKRRLGPSYLASRQFASGVLEYLGSGNLELSETGTLTASDLNDAIDKLAESKIATPLATFAREANGDVERLRLRIAEWYDDAAERWSGGYKRNAQFWSFVFAGALVLLLNADTFTVAKQLWVNPALRAEAVALGEKIAASQADTLDGPKYAEINEQLKAFPLGWDFSMLTAGPGSGPAPTGGDIVVCAILKAGGLVFSAFAVALGAPFWFEVLNKLNAIRGAGKKPESATSSS